jgi:DNA-binding transcriptional regulator YiaG
MTPTDITEARKRLGMTAAALGRALELEGRDPGRTVRTWETGSHQIPGPARVAIRLMLEARAQKTLQDAVQQAQALITPAAPPIAPSAPESRREPTAAWRELEASGFIGIEKPKTRRRG